MQTQQQSPIVGAIGIELGSSKSIISVAQRGGVSIITNDSSQRETINSVSFFQNQRLIGEQAANKVQINNKEEELLPEQITAVFLQKLKQYIKTFGIIHSDFVLSVPSFFTEQERKALLTAAKLADINVIRLFSESAAIALDYGLFRKKDLTSTAKNVLFIDFGQSKLTCFAASFTNDNFQILTQYNVRNLGVRDIDRVIFEHYNEQFFKSNGLYIWEQRKAKIRLLEAIAKGRIVLSGISDTNIFVEMLMEDIDFNETLSRADFEKIIQPILTEIQEAINNVKKELEEKSIVLHDIELIGGGTRIPIVQKIIEETMGLPSLRTLSAETVARGCAIMSAILSPFLQVAQYNVDELNYYPIKCTCQLEDQTHTQILFDKNCSFPSTVTLNCQTTSPLNIQLFYDPVPEGVDQMLSIYQVSGSQPKKENFELELQFELDMNGIATLSQALLREEEENKQIEIEQQNAQQQDNTQKQEPIEPIYTEIPYTFQEFNSLSTIQLQSLYDFEQILQKQDIDIKQIADKKNELEAYIYSMRDKLQTQYQEYTTKELSQTLLSKLEICENWLYEEGKDQKIEAYQDQLNNLKIDGNPIENRFAQFEQIQEYIKIQQKVLQEYLQLTSTNDPSYAHIVQQKRIKVFADVQKLLQWLVNINNQCIQSNKTKSPIIKIEEIQVKMDDCKKSVDKIFIKKEEKKEEKLQEQPQPTSEQKEQKQTKQQENPEKEAEQSKQSHQSKLKTNQQQPSNKVKFDQKPKFQPKQQFQQFLQAKGKEQPKMPQQKEQFLQQSQQKFNVGQQQPQTQLNYVNLNANNYFSPQPTQQQPSKINFLPNNQNKFVTKPQFRPQK